MNSIPLKTVTVDEMTSQVEELATEADKHTTLTRAKQPYLTTAKSIDEEVQEFLRMVDEDAVKETLGSSLGYYLGKVAGLRIQPQVAVDGLKKWAVEALGLSQPPYISDALLARLGVPRERDYKFGSRPAPYPGSTKTRTAPRWTDRGNQWDRNDRSDRSRDRRPSKDFGEEDRDGYRKQRRSFGNR